MRGTFYAEARQRSTIRLLCAAAVVTASAALAEPPRFDQGGFLFGVQYGPGFWSLDAARLEALAGQGLGARFAGQLAGGKPAEASHALALSLAYNILGHASVGADFTATGWNVFDASRGGAGFLVGRVAWHPLELVFLNKERRPVPLDVSTSFGVGYGIAGGGGNPSLGMDGLTFQWALDAQWFFTRSFALGLFVKGHFLDWKRLYLDYDNKVFVDLSGSAGGAFWVTGLTLTFRAGD